MRIISSCQATVKQDMYGGAQRFSGLPAFSFAGMKKTEMTLVTYTRFCYDNRITLDCICIFACPDRRSTGLPRAIRFHYGLVPVFI
jgi:hypothetical protein